MPTCIAGVGMCHTDVLPRVPDIPLPRPIVCGHGGAGTVSGEVVKPVLVLPAA